jgi:hypothetical protein
MKQTVLLILIGLMTIMTTACPPNNYAKAGKLAKDFSASVLVVQQVEVQAHKSGFIDDAIHQSIKQEFSQIADAGARLDVAINQSQNVSGAVAQIQVLDTLLSDLTANKITGIKDTNTKLEIQSGLLTVRTILDSIAAFGGK